MGLDIHVPVIILYISAYLDSILLSRQQRMGRVG